MPNSQVPHYLRLSATHEPALRLRYETGVQAVQDYLDGRLAKLQGRFRVTSRPSSDWALAAPHAPSPLLSLDHLVIPVRVDDSALDEFRRETIALYGESAIGADLSAGTGEYWCPRTPDQALFGTRAQAGDLILAEALSENGLDGGAVNLVIVDRGLDKDFVNNFNGNKNFQGGWKHTNPYDTTQVHLPGATIGEEAAHGRMMVRNILDLAPRANIWDLPLLPPRIWDIGVFISDAQAAFDTMLNDIANHLGKRWAGPWILVNAWAVFDRRSETPLGDYTNRLTHPFNATIAQAVAEGRDVVFCAGNCGQFCPDERCGPWDIGPGQDVLGANSHPDVISVGAVRVDAMWLGYSSQGPGQSNMAHHKPDLCAPSGFAETADAHTGNTGTSAASAVAAGVVAALRSRPAWAPGLVPPGTVRQILNHTARKTQGPHWNQGLGHGIIDVRAAVGELTTLFP